MKVRTILLSMVLVAGVSLNVSFQFRNGQYTHHNERKGVG
mgnify:CR=1 FL=1